MIRTPKGERPVEALRAGDLVATLDRGPQPIVWIGGRRVSWREMKRGKGLRPILVRANTFGQGRPFADTFFSRQHPILLSRDTARSRFIETAGVFAPVHALTEVPGIEEQCPTAGTQFIHILTKDHNILWSNGLATETLLMTPYSQRMTRAEPAALLDCPDDIAGIQMSPARSILHNKVARQIAKKISAAGVAGLLSQTS
ncbi:MAG: hypothetical protein HKN63_12165 [Rhodobacteraceae bacterium]|nr:hypothetical protein [Paracoccaceae bacterium]